MFLGTWKSPGLGIWLGHQLRQNGIDVQSRTKGLPYPGGEQNSLINLWKAIIPKHFSEHDLLCPHGCGKFGEKYYSKWHALGNLLILVGQYELSISTDLDSYRTGLNKPLNIGIKIWPPENFFYQTSSFLDARVSGTEGCMNPLDYSLHQVRWHIQFFRRTFRRCLISFLSPVDVLHDIPMYRNNT